MSSRFVALYTVGIDIIADDLKAAESFAKDFRRSIGITSGPGHPKGIPIAIRDDSMTVVITKVYEP